MTESDFLPEGTLRGLPGPLPEGERRVWQGAPGTRGVFLRVFHARLVALWFGAAALAFALAAPSRLEALAAAAPVLLAGLLALALLGLFAWLVHRTTVYTLTNRRMVLHVGIALPITLNLPFAQIEAAGLHAFRDGSGDLPLRLKDGQRIAYLHLWPHARPWRVARPEPMLRSVPEAARVARLLAEALAAHHGASESVVPVIVAQPSEPALPGRLVPAE
ncbi:photosynthetic complex putative assembly protein PuhB [Methylobacterium organophilum]|uniref:YdbS-like PH domain-containing protein n=1 Tax=Methylobacterium organophilum TaxID=410 RepID=A0ABQ4TBY1_METOR|nr:photosynthetic complex putative assembly protein PuhB [Methylobacterium organophilum]GJE28556.1 hypothetical protein LKMONMHP_3428 [Methylobacterium organophilum]